jgi:hypothetical protein
MTPARKPVRQAARQAEEKASLPGSPVAWLSSRVLNPSVHEEVEKIRIVDSHEHLDEEEVRLGQPNDLTRFFMYYTFSDLVTAGLPADAQGKFFATIDPLEQWSLIRKYWPLARHTGFSTAVRLSIRELYGIDDLRDDTIKPLLEAVAARNRPGVNRWILKTKCNIECCLVNASDPGDLARRTKAPGLFLFDMSVSDFMGDKLDMAPFEKFTGLSCSSLRDWKRIVDWYFARWGRQAVAIKNVCAYWRPLKFEDVPEERAAACFDRWALRNEEVSVADRRAAQDHMFHYCIRRATDYGLPVKIHTGYFGGNGYMDMSLFQVKDLANLFRQYPDTKFVAMHLGYPEHGDLVALAKHYANVWVDFCWGWIIDPQAGLETARAALTALPVNKLFGFGGDYGYADVVYGHQRIARDGISLVLSEAVRDGRLTKADAKDVARRWLRDNAMEVFRIEDKRKAQAMGQPGARPNPHTKPE